ncbi:MAG: hypothetical protein GWO24_37440 [Akkermansiaceae bacterium]|nr:hypothetical protein [Akkermansiaceae bacterium]
MTEREQAANHLKVIRSLMERATVYRAISWPTALFGGSLAVILSALLFFREQVVISGAAVSAEKLISEEAWVLCWVVALVVTSSFNAFLVSRKSKREGRPFFSPGLKMALRAAIPPMLAGGVMGTGLTLSGTAAVGAAVWVICYGLALLATRGFAPKSIPLLGWAFLLMGTGSFLYTCSDGANPLPGIGAPAHMESPMLEANLIMGLSFGLFHLIYGFIVMKAASGGMHDEVEPSQ